MRAKLLGLTMVAGFVIAWLPTAKAAFHESNSLICSGCHTMHDSEDGADVGATGKQDHLLRFANSTDLCLDCHDGDNVTWTNVPDVLNVGAEPELSGGDFNYVIGNSGKGHNPVSAAYSITADATLGNTPPGGVDMGSALACVSCHDPHGAPADSFQFRVLNKILNPAQNNDVSTSITSVNADEATLMAGASNVAIDATNHNIYKGDFGTWCAGCHSNGLAQDGTGFHGSAKTDSNVGNSSFWERHPTNTALGATYTTNYSGSGTYDAAYPIEQVGGTWTTSTVASTAATDKVFCLTCHKAHATNYANSTRWDNSVASGTGTGCNKCHAK